MTIVLKKIGLRRKSFLPKLSAQEALQIHQFLKKSENVVFFVVDYPWNHPNISVKDVPLSPLSIGENHTSLADCVPELFKKQLRTLYFEIDSCYHY